MDKYDVAAQWWGKQVRDPHFNNGNDLQSILGTLTAQMTAQPITEDCYTKFERILAEMLRTRPIRSLGVDYGPDLILFDAAKAAGGAFQFPWKTNMWIDDDEIRVARGYHGELEVIWKKAKPT